MKFSLNKSKNSKKIIPRANLLKLKVFIKMNVNKNISYLIFSKFDLLKVRMWFDFKKNKVTEKLNLMIAVLIKLKR